MFQNVAEGKHGPTVTSENPKLDAYKQAAYVQNVLGKGYTLTSHDDGCYTLAADGLESLTFAPAADNGAGHSAP